MAIRRNTPPVSMGALRAHVTRSEHDRLRAAVAAARSKDTRKAAKRAIYDLVEREIVQEQAA